VSEIFIVGKSESGINHLFTKAATSHSTSAWQRIHLSICAHTRFMTLAACEVLREATREEVLVSTDICPHCVKQVKRGPITVKKLDGD